ncbi:hypothetical protein FRC11_006219 [Ceratobasidium sp. 423]|nr:hypothetical protein FRC11_006219 [Ceratobasidium sp. 423]
MTNVTFPIPSSVPSGEYLVRVEHIALHLALNYQKAEFYVSCAQVRVINGGSGDPKPLIALPGNYTGKEPGILVNIYILLGDPLPDVKRLQPIISRDLMLMGLTGDMTHGPTNHEQIPREEYQRHSKGSTDLVYSGSSG